MMLCVILVLEMV
jgi:hypothetical protein